MIYCKNLSEKSYELLNEAQSRGLRYRLGGKPKPGTFNVFLGQKNEIKRFDLNNDVYIDMDAAYPGASSEADVKKMKAALKCYFDADVDDMSPAKTAINVIFKSYKRENRTYIQDFPKLSDDVFRSVKSAYRGGLVLSPKAYRGEVYVADINSAYPNIVTLCKLPVGTPEVVPGFYTKPGPYQRFYEVEFLKCDGKKSTVLDLPETIDRFFDKPLTLAEQDVQLLKRIYTGVTIICKRTLVFKARFLPILGKFIEKTYALHDDDFLKLYAKQMLNGFIGAFGATTRSTTSVKNFKIEKNKELANRGYIALPATVNAIQRLAMFKLYERLEQDVIYGDTDSVFLKTDCLPSELRDDKELGFFKVKKYDDVVFFNKRAYILRAGDKFEPHVAGVPKFVLSNEVCRSLFNNKRVVLTWKERAFDEKLKTKTVIRKLELEVNKT